MGGARRFVMILAIIAGAAFVGRAVYILTVTRHETGTYDRAYYAGQAELLADGKGFTSVGVFGPRGEPDALHPPLTGLTLAPAAWLTNGSDLAYRFTVATAGVGVVVLIGLGGRGLAGPRAGLIAAGIAAIYPNLWMNDGLVMSETFAALGTAAAVLCTYRLLREPTWRNAAGTGVACALAMLSRSELVLLVPLMVVPAALTICGLRRGLRLASVAVAASLLVVAPWIAFNLTRFDTPVFLSSGDTGVLLGANCAETYSGSKLGGWYGLCTFSNWRNHIGGRPRQGTRDQAFDYMGDHLDRVPVVVAARVGRVWGAYRVTQMAHNDTTEGRPYGVSLAGWAMYALLVMLAVPGAVLLRRRRIPLLPLLGPVVVVTLSAAIFYGLSRFRTPAEISIVVLAAVALDGLTRRTQRERARVERARIEPMPRPRTLSGSRT